MNLTIGARPTLVVYGHRKLGVQGLENYQFTHIPQAP